MIDTSDVDDDFFTPSTGTKLSSIFGKPSKAEGLGNDSLKYVSPKPTKVKDDSKVSECLLACALFGFEWSNNIYQSRGKVGFAIMKNNKENMCHIIIYDGNKTTLSQTTISSKLQVKVKENIYLSYFDNAKKYWKMQTLIMIAPANEKGPLDPQEFDQESTEINSKIVDIIEHKDTESDTESFINKKSILSRMASMGQAILPPLNMKSETTTDSSDTNDDVCDTTNYKQKVIKSLPKQKVIDSDPNLPANHKHNIITKILPPSEPSCSVIMKSEHIESSSGGMNMIMTEQRLNNSEFRISLGRLSDKMDIVLNKLCENETKTTQPTTNDFLYQKLIQQYESKIELYELLLKKHSIIPDSKTVTKVISNDKPASKYEKDQNCTHLVINTAGESQKLKDEIKQLTGPIKAKSVLDEEFHKDKHSIDKSKSEEAVKSIMNETFQKISEHFQDNDQYSGESIKNIVAAIMKKATLKKLHS